MEEAGAIAGREVAAALVARSRSERVAGREGGGTEQRARPSVQSAMTSWHLRERGQLEHRARARARDSLSLVVHGETSTGHEDVDRRVVGDEERCDTELSKGSFGLIVGELDIALWDDGRGQPRRRGGEKAQ